MGNSTIKLQQIVDSVSAIGDLNPVLVNTGGFAAEPALTIANDVVQEMISERFPWKWNRMKYPPFYLISRQQDYAALSLRNLGWLENANRMQLNTTIIPPPTWPIEVVRDLAISRVGAGWPTKLCWYPNDQLEQGQWPGPNKTYTDPLGQTITPNNATTNILDVNGNILVLTGWGTTGATAPVAPTWDTSQGTQPANWPIGQVIADGTCQWTVADPQAQGIRVWPPPPDASGATWLIRVFGQKKPPVFTDLAVTTLEPIPDDNSKWFRDGFIAYAHRFSATPSVKKSYPGMKAEWLAAMAAATKAANREDEGRSFFPDKSLLDPEYYTDPGPGNPYWRQWGGS